MRFLQMEGPAHTRVKGVEAVTKVEFRIDLKRTGSCGIQELAFVAGKRASRGTARKTRRQGIVGNDGGVQLSAILDLPAQSVARNIGETAVAKQRNIEISRNAGRPGP